MAGKLTHLFMVSNTILTSSTHTHPYTYLWGQWYRSNSAAVKERIFINTPVLWSPLQLGADKMTQDYSGFPLVRNVFNNGTVALNNPADISVIVIYFLVVLAVGIWVSSLIFPLTH